MLFARAISREMAFAITWSGTKNDAAELISHVKFESLSGTQISSTEGSFFPLLFRMFSGIYGRKSVRCNGPSERNFPAPRISSIKQLRDWPCARIVSLMGKSRSGYAGWISRVSGFSIGARAVRTRPIRRIIRPGEVRARLGRNRPMVDYLPDLVLGFGSSCIGPRGSDPPA